MVGGGISGLTCAQSLRAEGVSVVVFEKSRGVGGRMATRRVDGAPGFPDGLAFDHGAQYFTARDPRFAVAVESWLDAGVVRPWNGTVVALTNGECRRVDDRVVRYVGVPGMSALCGHLAGDLTIHTGYRVDRIEDDRGAWTLVADDGRSATGFDAVVLAAPAPQTAALAERAAPRIAQRAREVRFAPCFAVMLALPSGDALPFDAAFVEDSPLAWIARDGSKSGGARGGPTGVERFVLHATPEWSTEHFDDAPDAVAEALHAAFLRAVRIEVPAAPLYRRSHRWAYARPTEPLEDRCLFDGERAIGACGDWCGGARVEAAHLSGVAMARSLLAWAESPAATRRDAP